MIIDNIKRKGDQAQAKRKDKKGKEIIRKWQKGMQDYKEEMMQHNKG